MRIFLAASAVGFLAAPAGPPDGGGPAFGPVTATLNGAPAPPASSASCGFRLLAAPAGPQIALLEPAGEAVVALEPGEEAALSIPMTAPADPVTVWAEAALLMGGPADVSLSLGATTAGRFLGAGESAPIEVSGRPVPGGSTIVLRAAARGPGAIRWRRLRVRVGDTWHAVPLSAAPADPGPGPPLSLPDLRRPLEEALIEWDWRMQDGIGTPRRPVSYAVAVERTIARGDALLRDLQIPVPEAWESLRREWKELASSSPGPDDPRGEDLWRRVHALRRRIALENPAFPRAPIVFVKQVPGIFSHQLTQYYGSCARPGGGIFVLEDPGRSLKARRLAPGSLPEGSYQHLEISRDGRRLLFAYCRAETAPKNREERLDRFFHLYEMAADGSGLKQLTDGPYDDFSPRLLPDGRILFVSTRRGGYHRCGRGPCPVYTLAVAGPDGSRPRPISFHETHEWDPVLLNDGRVLYTRWDYVDRHAVHYQQLWTTRPDGSDVRAFYGNNTLNPVGIWEAQPVPGSSRVMATAAAHHAMTAGSIVLLDAARGVDGPDPIARLTPDVPFPESEAPVLPNWRAPAGVAGAPPSPEGAARWPGHCYRSPCPLSEKYFLAAYSFDSLRGEPLGNPPNMFGLYLVDAFGNKELLHRDLNLSSLWPAPLRPRAEPHVLPPPEGERPREGRFLLVNVRAGWPALPPVPIRRLRIVQVLPKSTPHINDPPVGIPNASPGRQVLGTVPVEPDGSAWFTVPAGIPLAFQALDERGLAVQTMRSLTYLQPGETNSCIGCHEPRTQAPPPGRPPLALARPPSAIEPGPDGSKPLSYPILVQPVLDRHCVRCHGPEKTEGGVSLTGAPQGRYTVSYNALAPLVPHSAWRGGDFLRANGEPTSPPGRFGAWGSRLMKLILEGHQGVTLGPEEIERLATWMDANVLFYGTFDQADQRRQQQGQRIRGPKLE